MGKRLYFLKGHNENIPILFNNELKKDGDQFRWSLFSPKIKKTPVLADIYRKIVMNIPNQLQKQEKDGLVFGKAAFYVWTDTLGKLTEFHDLWRINGRYAVLLSALGGPYNVVKRCNLVLIQTTVLQ